MNIKKILFAASITLALFALHYIGIGDYINLETIQGHKASLQSMVTNHYLLAAISYVCLYIVATACSLPIAAPLTLAGGFFFGTIPAIIFTNIGATTGAIIVFIAVRYLIGDYLQKRYEERLGAFNTAIEQEGTHYLLSIRLIPIIPFFITNILAALTRVPLRTFVWTTSLGIIPGSIVFAFAGKQLGTLESVHDIFSINVLMAFALLALLALLPVIIKRLR